MSACTKSFPCKVCQNEVSDGIKCDVCCRWMHQRCSQMNKRTFQLYCTEAKLIWVCPHCRYVARQALNRNIRTSSLTLAGKSTNSVGGGNTSLSSPGRQPRTSASNFKNNLGGLPPQSLCQESSTAGSLSDAPMHSSTDSNQKIDTVNIGPKKPSYRDVLVSTLGSKQNRPSNSKGGEDVIVPKSQAKRAKIAKDASAISKLQAEVKDCNTNILKLAQEFNALKLRYDTELGRNRNILIHGYDEHVSTIPHVRKKAHEALVKTVLRNADLPPGVRWRRIHRIGRWTKGCPPRPLLVEFCSQRDRDIILSRLSRIRDRLTLPLIITPDVKDHVIGKLQTNAISTHLDSKIPRVMVKQVSPTETIRIHSDNCSTHDSEIDLITQTNLGTAVDLTEAAEDIPSDIWHDATDDNEPDHELQNPIELVDLEDQPYSGPTTNVSPQVEAGDNQGTAKQPPGRVTRSMTIRKNAMIPRAHHPRD